ncbi:hypothetical protein [Polaromonas sp. UC242_47]|uniref:hypothetical protein n=1 Tax=Polaromonas sp. UC242_47 TaxID=3374626 RepID=UPI00378CB46C
MNNTITLPLCLRPLSALLATSLLMLVGLPAWAQFPTTSNRTEIWSGSGATPDRDAIDRDNWQWQREQQMRQQRELTRQQDEQIRQSQESLGQRALREQAQRNGTYVPDGPGLSDQEQAWREQQQLRRAQIQQQRELTRQDDWRQQQSQESLGQRALREQAQNRREQGRAAVQDNRQFSPDTSPPTRPPRPMPRPGRD